MAAGKEEQATKLVLKVITGTATSGKAITSNHSYAMVNPSVTDDDMLDVGVKLADLQQHDVLSITRIDTANLVEMG